MFDFSTCRRRACSSALQVGFGSTFSAVCIALLVISATLHSVYAAEKAPPGSNTAAAAPTTSKSVKSDSPPKILTLPQLQQTPQSIEKVIALQEQGDNLFDQQRMEQALAKWQDAYGSSIEMGYLEGQGRALTGMARLYLARGQATKAKELAENAIEVLGASADKKSLGEARIALAQAYYALDNGAWAGQQLDLAMNTFSELGNNDSADAARVMELAGQLLLKQHKLKEAINFFQGAATFYGQAGQHFQQMSIRTSLVALMEAFGYNTASLEEAQHAVDAAQATKNPVHICGALLTLGNAKYNLCEYSGARKSFEEALRIQPPEMLDISVANLYMGYGCALAVTGDIEQAGQFFKQAYPVMKEKSALLSQAQLVNSMGVIEDLLNHHNEAGAHFQHALELQAVSTPKIDRLHVIILQNLAAAESRAGHNRNAASHLQNALAILKTLKDPLRQGRVYTSLSEVYINQKDLAQAQQYVQKGILISESINDDAALWQDYTILAQIQAANSAPSSSINESLNSALSYLRSPQAGLFPSAEELVYPVRREDMAHNLVSQLISCNKLEPAYLVCQQLKQESLVGEWNRRNGTVKSEDVEIYSDLANQRAHLHAAEAASTPEQLLKEWKSWQQRLQRLAAENRTLARLIAPVPVTYQAIAKAANAGNLSLVDYCIGNDASFVFTIDTAGKLSAAKLPVGKKLLQTQIANVLNSSAELGARRSAEKGMLQTLYSELFPAEIQSILPASPDQVVAIIPDDALFNLPFAALLTPQGQFLVENHALTMASSAAALSDSPEPYCKDHSILVAAGTSIDTDKQQHMPPETNVISNLFEADTTVHVMGKGSEFGDLQEHAQGKAVLHFPNRMRLSEHNPFHSVLATGSTNEPGDSITANSLFDLNLPNDLAVWSDSSIDAREFHGHAVKVFSSGLRYAGIRNILMSLWIEPEPERTNEIIDFYRNSQKGLNEAQSLRQAQLVAMSRDSSVKSWAAFQLIGPGY